MKRALIVGMLMICAPLASRAGCYNIMVDGDLHTVCDNSAPPSPSSSSVAGSFMSAYAAAAQARLLQEQAAMLAAQRRALETQRQAGPPPPLQMGPSWEELQAEHERLQAKDARLEAELKKLEHDEDAPRQASQAEVRPGSTDVAPLNVTPDGHPARRSSGDQQVPSSDQQIPSCEQKAAILLKSYGFDPAKAEALCK